ncbi:MAG: glycine C-acetyltransferase [Acidobacteriota bacterium]|nr:glycine C-acetyltransferase [Acidobacteriota bacterium]
MPQPQLQYMSDEIEKLKEQGLYQRLRILQSAQLPVARFDGREVINLSSNNYLGLTTHPKMKQRALDALEKYGAGSGAVRTIAGTMTIHMELEEKISEFKNSEASVVFQSGFTANAGTVAAIIGPEDIIISDELNHASIIDGCRLSKAQIKRFPHKDIEGCEKVLKEIRGHKGHKLLITDGVFSMDGDIAPLPDLVKLAEEYGCIMMIDDAHSSGVLGRNGRGTVDHFGLHGRVDIQVGTLSKAIGVLGGYVCSTRGVIEFLYHRARPFLFSTSHPPSVAASCLAAFELLDEEPQLIQQLWANTRFFKAGLERLGYNTGASETPITPIMVGDAALAHQFSHELFEAGVFAQGIGYPTVAKGRARLRTIVTATHTQDELARALGILETVGKKLRIV